MQRIMTVKLTRLTHKISM